jgi:membrane fusion protein (multidrug efflux system)
MNKSAKIILFAVIVLFIAGMALYPTIQKKLAKKNEPKESIRSSVGSGGGRGVSLNVNAQIMRPESLVDHIRVTGSLIPDEEVDLTFEASGKIIGIHFQEGSPVTKGQLLAKVNDKPLLAELQKLEAQIALAEDRVFRQKALLEKDAVSKEAYEQVSTDLEKLHADIELVKSRIAQTELRAPFDGLIGLRFVSEGAYATPATLVTHLTKVIPLKLEFSVNERHAEMIHPGTNIVFQAPPYQADFTASIYAVESQVDLDTRTLKARARFPNTSGKLKPGRMVNIEIKSSELKNALVIPNEAIIAEMGRDLAYIYSDGKAKQVELIKGLRTESSIQVLEGLNPGDTLITSGVMQLRDGLPVTLDNVR